MSESNDNISAPGPLRIPGWMIAGCAVTWTVAIAAAVWTLPVLHMPLRAVVALLLIGMAVSVLRSSSRPLILSPLYLLALFAFTAYSLLPLIFVKYLPLPTAVKAIVEYTFEAFGGLGEMLVLQFSAFCLTLSALAWRKFPLSGHTVHTDFTERPWTLAAIGSTGLVIVLSSIPLLGRQWPWLGEFLTTGIGLQIHDALPPLTSVCIITLAYIGAVRKGRYLALVAAVVVFYLAVKFTTELAQIPVFIALSALLLVGAVGYTGLRSMAMIGSMVVLLLLLAIIAISIFRYAAFDTGKWGRSPAVTMRNVVIHKLFTRQGASAWCFDRIARSEMHSGQSGNPFYFLGAVVPRALWPDKPSLSRGYDIATTYCGSKAPKSSPHVELVTLMAEPIIEAGLIGLIVAQVFLGLCLTLLMIYISRGGVVRLIGLTAMLPWLIHFQQHFGLFLANAGKMYLFMLPLLVLLAYIERPERRRMKAGWY